MTDTTHDELTDDMLERLHLAGCTNLAIGSAYGLTTAAVRQRLAELGVRRDRPARRPGDEPSAATDPDTVRPVLERMEPKQPDGQAARPPRPAPELLARLPAELDRLEQLDRIYAREHAVLKRECEDSRALDRRARRLMPNAFACAATLRRAARVFDRWIGRTPMRVIDRKAIRRAVVQQIYDLADRVERKARSAARPDLQEHEWRWQEIRGDLMYARGAMQSLTEGAARSWASLDVAVVVGYGVRPEMPLDDDQVDELRDRWGWTAPESTEDLDEFEDDDGDGLGVIASGGTWQPMEAPRSDMRTSVQELERERRERERA